MKINDFTGGLSTRRRPQFLELNQAAEYSNIDNSAGTLLAAKDKVATDTGRKLFNQWFDSTWIQSVVKRSYAELNGWLYWSNEGVPKKYQDGNTYDLGIEAPLKSQKPTVSRDSSDVEAVNEVNVYQSTGGDLPGSAWLQYKFVNRSSDRVAFPLTIEVNTGNGKVRNVQGGDAAFTSTWVTRNAGLLNQFQYYNEKSGKYEIRPEYKDYVGTVDFAIHSEDYIYKDEPWAYTRRTSNNYDVIQVNFADIGAEIGSEGVDVYRFYKQKWRKVGTITGGSPTLLDGTYDISGNAQLEEDLIVGPWGWFQYVYTYYDSERGIESGPSFPSKAKRVYGVALIEDMAVSDNSAVDKKRIYRVGGSETAFTLVAEIDNADTTYVDGLGTTELDGDLLQTQTYTAPPTDLKYILEAYAMLFGASGSRLYYTPINNPDAWPELNFIEFGTTITGTAEVSTGILVFTEFKTYIVLGSTPETLSKDILSQDQGCVGFESIQSIGNNTIWVSTDGICATNGGTVIVVSRDALGKTEITPIDSVVHDEVYYVLDNNYQILAYDFRFEPIFKRLDLGIRSFAVGQDTLYGTSDPAEDNTYTFSTLLSDLTSNTSMTWKSPRFVEGRITEEKTYKKVYISLYRDIILKVYIDDKLVLTREFEEDFHDQIQIPADCQRGHYIQFEITGTGEVTEIEYEVGRGNHG